MKFVAEELGELPQQERARARRPRVDDRGGHVELLEANDEICTGQDARGERSRSVSSQVDAQLIAHAHRIRERGRRRQLFCPERLDVDRVPSQSFAEHRLCEGAPSLIPRAHEHHPDGQSFDRKRTIGVHSPGTVASPGRFRLDRAPGGHQ